MFDVDRLSCIQVESARSIIGDLRTETEEAQSKAKHSDEQLRQLKDQYRRLQADFDNFRSRSVRLHADLLSWGVGMNGNSSVVSGPHLCYCCAGRGQTAGRQHCTHEHAGGLVASD